MQTAGAYLPRILLALVVLVVGWIVAWVVSGVLEGVLKRTELDNKLAKWISGEGVENIETEKWASRIIFWIIMLFVFIGFFEVLGLTIITAPLNNLLNEVFRYAPKIFGAGLLLLIAWVMANVVKFIVLRALKAAKMDETIKEQAELLEEEKFIPLSKSISEAVYWLVYIFFLPAILGALELEGLLEPVQSMLDKIMSFIPNLFAASIILAIGWFAARGVQRIVTNLLVAIGFDNIADKVGTKQILGKQKLSSLVGMIVYVFILIPTVLAGLNALKLDSITQPASNMLNAILGALPHLFAAALLLIISYIAGRIVSGTVVHILSAIGFNNIFAQLGIGKKAKEDERKPSDIAGTLIILAIMLFATIEAANLVKFVFLAELVAEFTVFAGQILLGLIIMLIGIFLSSLAANAVQESKITRAELLSHTARVSILILSGAMALRQMGLAGEIINLAFGLLLGAIAVAIALAFGLGGRDIAAREIEGWLKSIKSEA